MLGLDLCRDPVHICVVKHTNANHNWIVAAASLCCSGSASTRARFRACVWLEHLLFELVAGSHAELAKRLA
jgi:hypothetical protein